MIKDNRMDEIFSGESSMFSMDNLLHGRYQMPALNGFVDLHVFLVGIYPVFRLLSTCVSFQSKNRCVARSYCLRKTCFVENL